MPETTPSAVEYLAVGLLRRPHGVKGDLLMEIYTDFPERLRPGVTLYVGETRAPLKIARVRPHNDGLIIGFAGLQNPEQAAAYRTHVAYVPVADRPPLPEGQYYHHQLLGLQIVTEAGEDLGVLDQILETGANDVYVVLAPGKPELLLPAIPPVVRKIDLQARTMTVHLLDGLLSDTPAEQDE
jgi:16S rRNA processing protein RimM